MRLWPKKKLARKVPTIEDTLDFGTAILDMLHEGDFSPMYSDERFKHMFGHHEPSEKDTVPPRWCGFVIRHEK